MKSELIDLLEFPRALAKGTIPLEDCTHAGNYCEGDAACQRCESALECQWLYHGDELSGLAGRPLPAVIEALGFAVVYVDTRISLHGHIWRRCSCHACSWLRRATGAHADARALLDGE